MLFANAAERRARVTAGAQFLDTHYPHWYSYISSARLDLSNNEQCVLGQLYGRYSLGLKKLGLWWPGRNYGFLMWRFWLTDELTEAWREEIAQRRLALSPVRPTDLVAHG